MGTCAKTFERLFSFEVAIVSLHTLSYPCPTQHSKGSDVLFIDNLTFYIWLFLSQQNVDKIIMLVFLGISFPKIFS